MSVVSCQLSVCQWAVVSSLADVAPVSGRRRQAAHENHFDAGYRAARESLELTTDYCYVRPNRDERIVTTKTPVFGFSLQSR
jgi:hypothetical protein